MKAIKVSENIFNNFINISPYTNYFQSVNYSKALNKTGKKTMYVAFIDRDQNIIGACMIILGRSFMGMKRAYIPRGIMMDYTKTYNISKVLSALRSLFNKENIIYASITPQLVMAIRDKNGHILKHNKITSEVIKEFKKGGALHKGYTYNLTDKIPRFEAHINLKSSAKDLYSNMDKETRNKVRKALKYGVSVYQDNTKDINKYLKIINKDKKTYNLYKALIKEFQDNFEIYYSYLNTSTYVENAKKLYENEIEINSYLTSIIETHTYKGKHTSDILNKKLESDKLLQSFKKHLMDATNLLRKYPEGFITSCIFLIKDKEEIFIIEDSYNKEINLPGGFLNRWKVIEKYASSDYKILNMGLIRGKNEKMKYADNLTEMKLRFGAHQIEYIGEFDLIANSTLYNLFK